MTNTNQDSCLVTGASGVIGRPVVRHLLETGHKVLAVGRSANPFEPHDNLTYVPLDLHDNDAVKRFVEQHAPGLLVHLAWEATPGKFWHSLENFRWISSSAFLLDSFVKAGGKRAVLAGSCAEYKWGNEVLVEDTSPVAPTTYYSASKNAFREMAEVIGRDIDLVWARIFFPYGPGEDDSKLISCIVREIREDRLPDIRTPGRAVDFIHLEDAARAIGALAYSDLTGAVNVCSGQAVLPHQVALEIARLTGRAEIAGTLEKLLADIRRDSAVVGSIEKLAKVLDPKSCLSLQQGLETYLQ